MKMCYSRQMQSIVRHLCYLIEEKMKKPELKFDFANDWNNIHGKVIHLYFLTSGYYAVPLNEINLNSKTSVIYWNAIGNIEKH